MWRENRTIDDYPLCHGNHWILHDAPAPLYGPNGRAIFAKRCPNCSVPWTHAGVPEEETENA